MFRPPRCPNPECDAFEEPWKDFYVLKGSYQPKCRAVPVPRFKCKGCNRGFSRQTFRQDYYDKMPHLNPQLLALLASGVGLRQAARLLSVRLRTIELKFRKLARQLRFLHSNLLGDLPETVRLQLDEMETFEGNRRTKPLTLPLLIEEESMYVLGGASAPIPPSGKMSPRRLEQIRATEEKEGKRPNESSACIRRILERAAEAMEATTRIVLSCDEKTTYPKLARAAFGEERLRMRQFSSRIVRDTANPLFKINLTNAMARDLNGRLRRRSWLASKKRKFLDLQLAIFIAWRNYHRYRFNRDRRTPAQILGFCAGRLSREQLLSWRQDWGRFSVPVETRAAAAA